MNLFVRWRTQRRVRKLIEQAQIAPTPQERDRLWCQAAELNLKVAKPAGAAMVRKVLDPR